MNNLDAAILGVKLASKILEIPEPKVFFVDDNNINNNMITGIFISDDYDEEKKEELFSIIPSLKKK